MWIGRLDCKAPGRYGGIFQAYWVSTSAQHSNCAQQYKISTTLKMKYNNISG